MKQFIEIIMDEQWKDLIFPNIKSDAYLISNYGRIFSKIKNRIIKSTKHCQGYKHITLLSDKGQYKKILVHRLVAWHFVLGYSDKSNIVNHNDGIKMNNYYKNLSWVTNKENVIHALESGLNKCSEIFTIKYKGSGNPNFKYSDNIIIRICELLENKYKAGKIADIILEEFPSINVKRSTIKSYIQYKIKSKLLRTDISSNYIF
jgi:hypothetical protein